MNKIIKFFDKFEDNNRGLLSHFPIIYSIIGGVAIVLFWRGVWHTADIIMVSGFRGLYLLGVQILETRGIESFLFYEPVNMIISMIVLLSIGLFVSFFIGDQIIISGLKNEKKLAERTEGEVEAENTILSRIEDKIEKVEEKLGE